MTQPPEREPAHAAPASWERLVRATELGFVTAAALLGAIGLAGWVFSAPELTRLFPGLASMKVNTGICLVLLAAGRAWPGRASTLGVAAAAALMAPTALQYPLGRGLGIDQLLATDPGGGEHPGRPALATAIAVLLLAVCWLPPLRDRRRTAQGVQLVVLGAMTLVILGYIYGVRSLYALTPFGSIAVHTATALGLLSLAGLVRVDRGIGVLPWLLLSRRPGATLMRVAMPIAVLGIPVAGYLGMLARRHGTGESSVIATLVLVGIVALLLSAWWSGVRLDGVDRRRRQALADLRALNERLEVQVEDRTAAVRRGRDELVLLAERQRIAADLHDVVVQRLFAAGMTLSSITDGTDRTTVRRNLDTVIDAMDAAIKDLRTSIFELNTPATASNELAEALDELCTESSRVLGYHPQLTFDDPDHEADTMAPDILAVAREGLANVGRHARASSASLVVRTGDGYVTVEVVDDGVGLRSGGHRSGTRNMLRRADRLGGSCEWLPGSPNGTRLVWRVPARVA